MSTIFLLNITALALIVLGFLFFWLALRQGLSETIRNRNDSSHQEYKLMLFFESRAHAKFSEEEVRKAESEQEKSREATA